NRELEHRREEIRAELKQGLKADQGTEKEIDVLIDKFWDELLRSIGDGRGVNAAAGMIDEKKLQAMLKRILETLSAESPAAKTAQEPVLEELESPSDFEELEELSKVEELEEFDQAKPAGLSPEKEPEAFEAAELEEIFEGSGLAEWAGDGSPASKKSLNPEEIDAAEAIIAKSPSRKRSNIQLAFGDDDIPYIVESSGLELVDEDFNSETAQPLIEKETPAAAGADDQDKFPEELEGFEELEELEPVEDAEELEPIDEVPVPEDFSLPPAQDMNDMASEIEFGFLPELEEDIPEGEEDLEIVSPFADIFSDFSDAGGETEKQAPEKEPPENNREPSGDNSKKSPQAKINKAGLEELENNSAMSLISKPFLFENRLNPEYLETLEDSAPAALPAEEVIEERDGLPFINQASFYPPEDAGDIQDREFKDLVESVLKQGRTRP
ncbi:MAG: hypothetical protein LBT95_09490, partial [Treponema sp.]|nr:hypothetical protein [Treponema sp.]